MTLFAGRHVSLWSTGMYMPERVLTNADLEKIVDTSDAWIRERSGICQRHIAVPTNRPAILLLGLAGMPLLVLASHRKSWT